MEKVKSVVIANWKSNPSTLSEAVSLASQSDLIAKDFPDVECILAVPHLFIGEIQEMISHCTVGAQDAGWESGPYTGAVSWSQLYSMNVRHVIIGHSERRSIFNESDDVVGKKTAALLEHGMTPILCIGERDRGGIDKADSIATQLRVAVEKIKRPSVKKIIIAFEPVWAISTNPGSMPDTPRNAFESQLYIRRLLADMFDRKTADAIRIVYGGSLNGSNASDFAKEGHMCGGLVGKASLSPKEFRAVMRAFSVSNKD